MTREPPSRDERPPVANANWGWRLGTEMVSATMIGAGTGYFLDGWLDTRPWLFLVFFIFGVAAGFLNVYRAAQALEEKPSGDHHDSSNEG